MVSAWMPQNSCLRWRGESWLHCQNIFIPHLSINFKVFSSLHNGFESKNIIDSSQELFLLALCFQSMVVAEVYTRARGQHSMHASKTRQGPTIVSIGAPLTRGGAKVEGGTCSETSAMTEAGLRLVIRRSLAAKVWLLVYTINSIEIHNVFYKRAVLTGEPSTPPTLTTFKAAQLNNVVI
jgi:hypothetical protein